MIISPSGATWSKSKPVDPMIEFSQIEPMVEFSQIEPMVEFSQIEPEPYIPFFPSSEERHIQPPPLVSPCGISWIRNKRAINFSVPKFRHVHSETVERSERPTKKARLV